MSWTEVTIMARATWFIGVILFALGFLNDNPGLIVGSGLAIGSGLISMAILATKK